MVAVVLGWDLVCGRPGRLGSGLALLLEQMHDAAL